MPEYVCSNCGRKHPWHEAKKINSSGKRVCTKCGTPFARAYNIPMENSSSKYCPLCDRQVVPKKKVPWVSIILVLVLLGWMYGLGVLIALWLYVSAPEDECPICNAKVQSEKLESQELDEDMKKFWDSQKSEE